MIQSRLANVLDEACQRTPDNPCSWLTIVDEVSDEDVPKGQQSYWTLTYRHAQNSRIRHETWLQQKLSTISQKSDDVAVAYLSHNSFDFILSVLAATSETVHSLPALLNTRWTAAEMVMALQSQSKEAVTLLLYGPELEAIAQEVASCASHRTVAIPLPQFALHEFCPSWKNDAQTTDGSGTASSHWQHNKLQSRFEFSREDALIVFTSGTSGGRAKGVRLSHAAIATQCWAKCLSSTCDYSSGTVLLASTVPFFHIGGLSSLLAVWIAGGQLVLPVPATTPTKGAFRPETVWKSIADEASISVNTLVVVPAMLYSMQMYYEHNRNQFQPQNNTAVRTIVVGGQSISDSQKDFLKRTFPRTRVIQTYACTEGASSLTFRNVLPETMLGQNQQKPSKPTNDSPLSNGDCIGQPPAHIDLCLIDRDHVKENHEMMVVPAPWSPGIIATRGPHVMNGYWQRGTKDQMNRSVDQWFLTNDIAYWDDQQQLYFCGRVNDSIRTGGETVLALEVERVLQHHPAIRECAVFPIPDPKFGQAVACAIVPSTYGDTCNNFSSAFSVSALREWCLKHSLAGYKRPRQAFLVDQLPKNSSGKILKYQLVEQFSKVLRSRL